MRFLNSFRYLQRRRGSGFLFFGLWFFRPFAACQSGPRRCSPGQQQAQGGLWPGWADTETHGEGCQGGPTLPELLAQRPAACAGENLEFLQLKHKCTDMNTNTERSTHMETPPPPLPYSSPPPGHCSFPT